MKRLEDFGKGVFCLLFGGRLLLIFWKLFVSFNSAVFSTGATTKVVWSLLFDAIALLVVAYLIFDIAIDLYFRRAFSYAVEENKIDSIPLEE